MASLFQKELNFGVCSISTINGTFKNVASGHYWSLMYKITPTGKNWSKYSEEYSKRIYFSDGYSYDNDRTGKAYVRCVRNKNIL